MPARKAGQPLFLPSQDVDQVKGRRFDNTLVLATAHPDHAIIQPAIRMSVEAEGTYCMHLEARGQHMHEPLSSTICTIFAANVAADADTDTDAGESSFSEKGLSRNAAYIHRYNGTESTLIEAVPIGVLSHDAFEAAVLRPMYTKDGA